MGVFISYDSHKQTHTLSGLNNRHGSCHSTRCQKNKRGQKDESLRAAMPPSFPACGHFLGIFDVPWLAVTSL